MARCASSQQLIADNFSTVSRISVMAALTLHSAEWQDGKLFQAPSAQHVVVFTACSTPASVLDEDRC
jgi:hypothetical protein